MILGDNTMRLATINAVICKDYKSYNVILNNNTWKKFKKTVSNCELYLYGAGKGCEEFIAIYGNKYKVHGIIDGSPDKIGKRVGGIEVFSKNIIERFDENNKVILITSASYMDDIAEEISGYGFNNYFSFATMEAKKLTWKLFEKVADFYIWRLHKVKKNQILFWNHMAPQNYACNLKYIAEELRRENLGYDIVWVSNLGEERFPAGIKIVNSNPIELMKAHAQSRIWIDNYKKDKWMKKKKGQYYINTWHGSLSLKKLDFDTPVSSKTHLIRTELDSSLIDLRLSNSKVCTEMYRRAMHYTGEVMECGSPRLDKMNCRFETVYRSLDIPNNAHILLYAPTWRTITKRGEVAGDSESSLDFYKIKAAVEKKFGGEWYIVIRRHPQAQVINGAYAGIDFVRDGSFFEDVYELLAETQLLISDYSSLIFEAGFAYKKVFIIAEDLDRYKEMQGTYFDLKELPYPCASNEDELIKNIENYDADEYKGKVDNFHNSIELHENGDACIKVVERIKEIMNE